MKKVYVDAGHRNNSLDCGAVFDGRKESKDALSFALLLSSCLKKLEIDVKLSRNSENDIKSLTARTNEANKWGADLFISIHRNASLTHKGEGAETLFYAPLELAYKLQECMVNVCGFKCRGGKIRTDLHVLKASKMKAILLEIGFIDNVSDNEKFDKNKSKLAEEIAQIIKDNI